MKKKYPDLDSAIEDVEAQEARYRRAAGSGQAHGKELVGEVETFFEKLNVVAIKLSGRLKVGDIIEIGDEEEAIRQKVSSMQINRKSVEEADRGDSVGIKLRYPVAAGKSVYRMS